MRLLVRMIVNIQVGILLSKRRNTCMKLSEASRNYKNLESFHYYSSMDPCKHLLVKGKLEDQIALYNKKISYINAKINSLKWKLV